MSTYTDDPVKLGSTDVPGNSIPDDARDFLHSLTSETEPPTNAVQVTFGIKARYGQRGLNTVRKIYELCDVSYQKNGQGEFESPKMNLNTFVSFADVLLHNQLALREFLAIEDNHHKVFLLCSNINVNIYAPYFKAIRLSGSRAPIALHPAVRKDDFRRQTEVLFANYPEFRSTPEFVDAFHSFVSRDSQVVKVMQEPHFSNFEILAGMLWHLKIGLGEPTVLSLLRQIILDVPKITNMEFVDLCEEWDPQEELPLRWILEINRLEEKRSDHG